jgi:uncharacterized protein YjbI with pentapeptide repeats
MPYEAETALQQASLPSGSVQVRQELQVRRTAQIALTQILGSATTSTDMFDLDLSGASLVEFTLSDASIARADFSDSRLVNGATLTNVTFGESPNFSSSVISGNLHLEHVNFESGVNFRGSSCAGTFEFNDVSCTGLARLDDMTFSKGAIFVGSEFADGAWFGRSVFGSMVNFTDVNKSEASKGKELNFDGATVIRLDRNLMRQFPPGWTISPDMENKTAGILTRS